MDVETHSSLFTSLPYATCLVSREGRILDVNPALESLLGWTVLDKRGQLLADDLKQIADPAQALSWRVALSEALSQGVTTYLSLPANLKTEFDGPDRVSVIGFVAPWNDADGARLGAVILWQECITVEDMEAARARFLSMLAHELRSPLNNIVVAAEQMGRYISDASLPLERLRRIIQREIDRLRRVIGSFPTSAPLELHGDTWNPERVSLRPILHRVADDLGARHSTSEMAVKVPADLPCIWGDAQGIRYVLGKLVESALAHAPEDGRIVLEAEAQPGDVLVHVYVPDVEPPLTTERDVLAWSSRRAWRMGDHTSQDLGLLVTRKLVQAMGGALWSEQHDEGGRCFCMRLPVADERDKRYT